MLGTIEESILKRQTVKGLLSVVIKESNTHTGTTAQIEEEEEVQVGAEASTAVVREIDTSAGAGTEAGAGAGAGRGTRIQKKNLRKSIIRACNSSSSSSSSSSHDLPRVSSGRASSFMPSNEIRKTKGGKGEKGGSIAVVKGKEGEEEEEEDEEEEEELFREGDGDNDNDADEKIVESEEKEGYSSNGSASGNDDDDDDDENDDDDDENVRNQAGSIKNKISMKKKIVPSMKRKFPCENTVKLSSTTSSSSSSSSSTLLSSSVQLAGDGMTPDVLLDLVLPRGMEYWTTDLSSHTTATAAAATIAIHHDVNRVSIGDNDRKLNKDKDEKQGDIDTAVDSRNQDFHNSLLGFSLLDIVEV